MVAQERLNQRYASGCEQGLRLDAREGHTAPSWSANVAKAEPLQPKGQPVRAEPLMSATASGPPSGRLGLGGTLFFLPQPKRGSALGAPVAALARPC